MQVEECPQCGAPAAASERRCGYCRAEFFVTSLAYLGAVPAAGLAKYLKHYQGLVKHEPDHAEGLLGLGLCYLQVKNYQLAEKCFERVIDLSPEIPHAYYYYALAHIRGRRLRSLTLNDVRRIESHLSTAIALDGEAPHYRILLAMVKRDYYEANGMRVLPPTAGELLNEVNGRGMDRNELARLIEAVKVANPAGYFERTHVS